jgi:hypothetical protein
MATAFWLLRSERSAYWLLPSSIRATSRRRVISPLSVRSWTMIVLEFLFRHQAPLRVDGVSWNAFSPGEGWAPSAPAATCRFCSRIARTMSLAVRPRDGGLVGIEPDPQRIVAEAEQLHVADAFEAGEFILHIEQSRSWSR